MCRIRFIRGICSGEIKQCKNTFNIFRYAKSKILAGWEENVIFGGRLGEYKYYDMDKVIESALACVAVQMDKINQYKA